MVLHYLAEDMAEIPAFQVPEWVELSSCEPEGVELPSTEPEGEDPMLQSPEREEEEPPSPELEGEELQAKPPVFSRGVGGGWEDSPPLLSEEPAAFPLLSEESAALPAPPGDATPALPGYSCIGSPGGHLLLTSRELLGLEEPALKLPAFSLLPEEPAATPAPPPKDACLASP
ncbi:UNVERIFIED_CONTAM: hypothetical protein FKN15_011167 [Acipenser sinensis]